MLEVKRYDVGEVRRSEVLPNGWLRCDAALTRAGIFSYKNPDGSLRRELRPADEVFHADSLRSLEMVPATDDHPESGRLDAENTKELSVGHVGDSIRRDGDLVVGPVLVTDGSVVGKVQRGAKREVSAGYTCRLDPTPGEFNGERYDAVQRHIRYNHVAIVPFGRAGKDVRLRLDAGDAVQVVESNPQPKEKRKMKTIRIDGVDFEVSEQVAQAYEKREARRDADEAESKKALASKGAELEKEKARADSATAELEKEKALRADAADPVKAREAVKARVDLERKASKILGSETKLDAMDDLEVKRAVVAKAQSSLKLDGRSADYIAAAFDLAVEKLDAENPELERLRRAAAGNGANGEGAPAPRMDAAEVEKKHREEQANAWRKPLAASKDAK